MSQRDLFNGAVRASLHLFMLKAFEVLYPGTKFIDNWHISAIIQSLNQSDQDDFRRQIINIPPRSLKSTIVSIVWTAYLLGINPAIKIIVSTYSQELSEQLSNETRRLMESDFYRAVFPKTRLIKRTSLHLVTDQGGQRFATSVGGPATGFGGDLIIFDDPHNSSEAYSQAARDAVKQYYAQTLSTRLDDETKGRVMIIMQRLHPDDIVGHLLSQGGWQHLKLQAKATEDMSIDLGNGKRHEVKIGDLLHAQRLPENVLDRKQMEMGSANYAAQYLQDPEPATGNMIKQEWLCYYDQLPARQDSILTISLDTATKTSPSSDYSVCTAWLNNNGKHYLTHIWRDKVDYPGLKREMERLNHTYRPENILIEDHGSGSALIQELKASGVPAIAIKPRDSKESRLAAASSYIESGLILLPKNMDTLPAFVSELLSFPAGKHDDQIDNLTQYIGWIRGKDSPFSLSFSFFDYEGPTMESIAHSILHLK